MRKIYYKAKQYDEIQTDMRDLEDAGLIPINDGSYEARMERFNYLNNHYTFGFQRLNLVETALYIILEQLDQEASGQGFTITQEELAETLAVSRMTIARTIKTFQDKGIIAIKQVTGRHKHSQSLYTMPNPLYTTSPYVPVPALDIPESEIPY